MEKKVWVIKGQLGLYLTPDKYITTNGDRIEFKTKEEAEKFLVDCNFSAKINELNQWRISQEGSYYR